MTSIPIEEDWSKSRGGGGRNGVLCEHMAGDIRVGIVFEPLNVQMAFTATTFMEVVESHQGVRAMGSVLG